MPVLAVVPDLAVGPRLGLPLAEPFVAVVVLGVVPTVETRGFAGELVAELVDVNGLRAAAVVVGGTRPAVLEDGSTEVRLAVDDAVAGFFSSTDEIDLCDALSERDGLVEAGAAAEEVVDLRTLPAGGRVGGLFSPPFVDLDTEDVAVLGAVVEAEEPMRFAGTPALRTLAFSFLSPLLAGDSASVVSTSVLSPTVPSWFVSAPEVISPIFSSLSLNTPTLSPLSLILSLLNFSRSLVGDNHAK